MLVDCPECGASLEGSSGTEAVCPACMTPFLVPTTSRSVSVFDVQPGAGAAPRRMSRYAIREGIYLGQLTPGTRVRHDGGPWELVGGYPEFAVVFRLLGGDLAPMAGTRKLAGWGRPPAAEPSSQRVRPPARFEVTDPVATRPVPAAALPVEAVAPAPPVGPARPVVAPPPVLTPRAAPAPTPSGARLYLIGAAVVALVGLGFLLS
jgi:hypothetical protein